MGWDTWTGLESLGDRAVESHISPKTSEIWGTADSAYKCNISRIGDSCNMPRNFRHLDLSERVFLETQLSHGRRPARIAAELKRARSTITREIRRNGWRAKLRKGSIAGGYRSVAADRRARVLSVKARRPRKLKAGNRLWRTMLRHLRRGLSPVQIASTLARMADPVRLSHEAIYTALYAMPRGQLRASLLDLLRRRHKARRPARGKSGRSHSIPDMALIDRRPMEVNERLIPGHWEGDLIIGSVRAPFQLSYPRRAVEKWKANRASHFPTASATECYKSVSNRFSLHLEFVPAVPQEKVVFIGGFQQVYVPFVPVKLV